MARSAPQSAASRNRPPPPASVRPINTPVAERPDSSRDRLAGHAIAQFVAALLVYRIAAGLRLMDADEGHFLSAIRSVANGLNPFQDFFFQQTPLFLYPYAGAIRLIGIGHEPCRWVSIICGAGLATVTAAYFARKLGAPRWGWLGWWLIIANAQVFFWAPTVKNHALPLFAGAAALAAASVRCTRPTTALAWGALAGFCAIWSVGSRLPAAPLAGAAAGWMVLRAVLLNWSARGEPPVTVRGAWAGVLGFALGAAPPTLQAARSFYPDPWKAQFDIFEFHTIRSAGGAWGDWKTVSEELRVLGLQLQLPLIALLALIVAVGGVSLRMGQFAAARRAAAGAPQQAAAPQRPTLKVEWETLYLFACGVIAVLLSLLPRQTFHQYFMVPLLLFLFATPPLWRRLREIGSTQVRRATPLLLLSAYTVCGWDFRNGIVNHQERVFPDCWGLPAVRQMAAALAEHTQPDDVVFSTWQGFTFMAGRRDLPGNENFNARTIIRKITPEQAARLNIATDEALEQSLLKGEPSAIVIGFFAGQSPYPYAPGMFYRRVLYAGERRPDGSVRILMRPDIEPLYRRVEVPNQDYHELWVRR